MLTRRKFLALGGAAVASASGVGLYTWQVEPHWVEIVRRSMPLPHLPPGLAGRTVLQLSDLHVGPRVDSGYLIETLQESARLAPDFVAYTGDFITLGAGPPLEELARVPAHAPRGRLGTVAALGNHDYGIAWRQREVADRISGVLREAGATVLRNDITVVGGLQIAGLGDYWSPEFAPGQSVSTLLSRPPRPRESPELRQPAGTIERLDRRKPTIVLCHNPDAIDEPIWGDLQGWILAGHTHGGQCKPPFLPPPILPVRNERYTAGEFTVDDRRTLYINRGLGHLIQVRFNVRPEVTLFTLAQAPAAEAEAGA